MVKYFLLIPFFIFQWNFTLIKKFSVKTDHFYTDQLKNLYMVSGSKLIKYDFQHNNTLEYQDLLSGNITLADVSDPMRLLVYYSQFNKLLFLDRFLSPLQPAIELSDLGHEMVPVVCVSKNGGFWLYDEMYDKLFYYDRNLQQKIQSVNIASLTGDEKKPAFMTEYSNFLYLNVPDQGILIFDQFGGYLKTLEIKNIVDFQIKNNELVYFKNKQLNFYSLNTYNEEKLDLASIPGVISAKKEGDIVYILKKNTCEAYKLEKLGGE